MDICFDNNDDDYDDDDCIHVLSLFFRLAHSHFRQSGCKSRV